MLVEANIARKIIEQSCPRGNSALALRIGGGALELLEDTSRVQFRTECLASGETREGRDSSLRLSQRREMLVGVRPGFWVPRQGRTQVGGA